MKNLFGIFTALFTASLTMAQSQESIEELVRVNLVELEVKVKDLRGNFISGLTPDMFTVKENGNVQEIDSFEEIELYRLPEEEIQDYKSRIMLLLDLSHTSYPVMRRVFKQIREYVDFLYTGNTELGLAVNANGIVEFTSFTEDHEQLNQAIDRAEEFHAKHRVRRYDRYDPPNRARYPGEGYRTIFTPYPYRFANNTLYQHNVDAYYRDKIEVLGQFVNYLGAHQGKKNLVLITESWHSPFRITDEEGTVDHEGIISLKDIQTTCVQQKIAINVINILRNENLTRPGAIRAQGLSDRFFDRTADLASATSGNYFSGNQMSVAKLLERTLENAEQYYRIRYYSNVADSKFRRVKVGVDGLNRIASTFGGYFPVEKEVSAEVAKATVTPIRNRSFTLTADTDWMRWEWDGWRKRRANYAISQRVYDDRGKLVMEKVTAGELKKRKYQGSYEQKPLETELNIELPANVSIMRVETEITDLTSGKKVLLTHRADGEMT